MLYIKNPKNANTKYKEIYRILHIFFPCNRPNSSPLYLLPSSFTSSPVLILHFIIFIRNIHLSHLVFSNVIPNAFHLVDHPFSKKLFGNHNLIYLMGQDHEDFRRRIAHNFTPSALSIYTSLQQIIILDHVKSWIIRSSSSGGGSISLRIPVRDLNLETSQTVFVGFYHTKQARRSFTIDYNLFNVRFMKLPFDLPGFAFRKAWPGVGQQVDTLTICVAESNASMENGEEGDDEGDHRCERCRGGFLATLEVQEIDSHLFDFLYAAQDASTSSLLWAVTLLYQHHPSIS